MLGGLLSAYDLSEEEIFLSRAEVNHDRTRHLCIIGCIFGGGDELW